MKFLCAQPDKPLFIWQLQTLLSSLIKLKIHKADIVLLVLLEPGNLPSQQMKELENFATIHYYEDRPGRLYPASSKPYLFAKFWEQFPENRDVHYLFIESDMIVYGIPELPLSDLTWYWSPAAPYLETDTYEGLLGFPPTSQPAFGFHCYGKGADASFWYKVESDSVKLFEIMATEKIPVNLWICEMRAWMWNAKQAFTNQIHQQLIFNDGKGPRKEGAKLYHQLSTRPFSKRQFDPEKPELLPEVSSDFCLFDYLQAIRGRQQILYEFLHPAG